MYSRCGLETVCCLLLIVVATLLLIVVATLAGCWRQFGDYSRDVGCYSRAVCGYSRSLAAGWLLMGGGGTTTLARWRGVVVVVATLAPSRICEGSDSENRASRLPISRESSRSAREPRFFVGVLSLVQK
jgi:hypothetical protein